MFTISQSLHKVLSSATLYPSSPPAATLRGKMQSFVLRLPPQNKPRASFMQRVHCIPRKSCSHYNAICIHTFLAAIMQPTSQVSASLCHHFPIGHHLPRSPLLLVTTSLGHTPHATWMQPLQCVLQHQVSNPNVSTHMATKRDSNHAANLPGLHLPSSPLP